MNAPAPHGVATDVGSDSLEALRRSDHVAPSRPKKPWLPRLTVAIVIVGALGAAYGLLQPLLFPPRTVRLGDARVVEGGSVRARAVAEAAGWIEADPYPVTVRPLVTGVVTGYAVVEGQALVAEETVVAVLRSPEIENALALAEADHAVAEAEVARAQAVLAVRRSVLEQRLPQRTEVARLEGELATAKADLESARSAQEEAEASLERVRTEADAQERLLAGGAQAPLARETSRRRVTEAEATRGARVSERARATADVARVESLLALAIEGREDPRELAGAVREQEAEVDRAAAARARAKVALEVARRNVGHLTVRSPVDGIVMRLLSAPGSVAGPMESERALPEEAAGTTSTGVLDAMVGGLVALYDPQRIQARIDVPLQDVAQIGAGADVELVAAALPGRTLRGVVSRVVHEANILQAKLQVKVRILEPDPALRPEMLVKAKFLVTDAPRSGEATASRVLVPAESVRGDAVFLFDPTRGGRARRVAVRVIGSRDGMTEVEGDLGLSSRVVLDAVEDGERIRDAAGGDR